MNIGIDIDGTITSHPEFYAFLAEAWTAQGGEVHIITARLRSHRLLALEDLQRLGFSRASASGLVYLHVFPEDYIWPWPNDAYARRMKTRHAAWKAELCKRLQVVALYDDCPVNVKKCIEHGVVAFHSPYVTPVLT